MTKIGFVRGLVVNPVNTATQLDDESLREAFFKWADVAISQSNDLWALCLPFFGVCFLIVMHLHSKGGASLPLMTLLYGSAISSALSFFAGYKLKGSVVYALKESVSKASISIPDTAGMDGLFQFVTFSIGLILFLIALGCYSQTVAKALINTIKGK
ncbi:hypothetical protein [Sinorhizobium meliloti]|uniref:hypothetical protein n=1 Tax=Rhizobium meliloti TaxID=382 RepID=UPI000FDC3F36|nr:hypothetical protein [Sinorhizobium meliloti]RVI80154.1 hypothetical protein CN191_12270 [Sinorhizobium meliloti]